MGYFVVHAPRQTGKTTTLSALATELTAAGEYAALHFSCELARAAGDDYGAAQRGILQRIRRRAPTSRCRRNCSRHHGRRFPMRICSEKRWRRGPGFNIKLKSLRVGDFTPDENA